MNKNIKIFGFADEASPIIDEQIKAMKRNGLAGLEIRNVDNEWIASVTPEKAREVRAKLDDAGLVTWAIGSSVGKIDIEKGDFSAHLEMLKRMVEIAHILGAENLRGFSFFIPKDKNPADYKNEVIDRMGIMLDIMKGSGVTFCHENEKGIYGDVADRCLEILNTFPEIEGVFDTANFVQCKEDTARAWNMLKHRIKYVHIKDARMSDGAVVPPGKGDGNYNIILPEYIAMGGTCFTMEPHLTEFVGLQGLEREGEESNVGEISFGSNEEAFDFACDTFKKLLEDTVK